MPDDDMHERISGRVDAQKCQPQAPLADSQVANDMGQWVQCGRVDTVQWTTPVAGPRPGVM